MIFAYRWYVVALLNGLFLAFSVLYIIQPSLNELKHLRVTEKRLRSIISSPNEKLSSQKKNEKLSVFTKQDFGTIVLTDIERIANQQQLTIEQVQLSRTAFIDNFESIIIQLLVKGNFDAFNFFLIHLFQRSYLMLIDQVSIMSKGNTLHMQVDLKAVNVDIKHEHSVVVPYLDRRAHARRKLFCLNDRAGWSAQDLLHLLKHTPLRELKMVGTLQQGKRQRALIALADGVIIDRQCGDTVGREQATLISMNAKQLVFQFPNQQKRVVVYKNNEGHDDR